MKFGIFELDQTAGELRRNGSLVRLPPQPLQILRLLVESSGEIVDRSRIRQEVWGETAVDFDRSLNVAIAQIRAALNDDAENPRFIQTVPRRGYRFLADVEQPAKAHNRSWRKPLLLGCGVLLLTIGAVAGYRFRSPVNHPIRLAVLPFENISLGESDQAQSDAIFDELLTQLGGIEPRRMQVIGRRSVMTLTDRGAGALRRIGEKLGVGFVLEATSRRVGNGLTISERLVETRTETVIWSGTFAQDATPAVFEERVAARVSAAVLTTLFPGVGTPAPRTICRDGFEAYTTGRQLANRGTLKDLRRSLEFFGRAACPQSRAALAETLVRLERIGPVQPEAWESARTEAIQALGVDRGLTAAHLALGNIAFWHDWNWKVAETEFRTALQINPSDPDAHHDLAWLEVALGQRPEAQSSLDTALALDPFSARTRMDSAWLLLQLGRFQEAAAAAHRALELDPEMREANACLARAELYAGERSPEPTPDPKLDAYERATRLALAGSASEALIALEAAMQSRSAMMPLVAADPAFSALRDDARFRKIVAAMRL